MLYKLVHGQPITDIKVGRYTCGSTAALLAKEDESNLCRSDTLIDADQKATDDSQFLSHSVYNLEDPYNSKTAYIPVEERNLDETALCCEEGERLVPPVPSHFLPDRVSLFITNDTKREYTSTASSEAVPVNPYLNIHNTAAVPTTIIPSEEVTRTNSSRTAPVVPVPGISKYDSTHIRASCVPLPESTDMHSLLDTDFKEPSNDLFNPYKYLHLMEHDKGADVQLSQQYHQLSQNPPWQYQQLSQQHQQLSPPPLYQQPLQQYQQLPQSQHHQQLSQQSFQEQRHQESKRDGDVLIVSPYFPNIHDPLIDAKQLVAPPQYCHQNPPQPSAITTDHHCLPLSSQTQFLPQTWNESCRPPTSSHPYNNIASSVALENVQGSLPYQQQVYTNKVLGIARPHQWHDVKSEVVSPYMPVYQSQQDCGFSDTCNLSASNVQNMVPSQNMLEDNPTQLLYQKVAGWGGQTKLVFNSS